MEGFGDLRRGLEPSNGTCRWNELQAGENLGTVVADQHGVLDVGGQ